MVGKVKNETADVAIKTIFGSKPTMYLFLVGDSSEHEKANRVNRNIVATITDGEYKDLLLNNKCLRHSMNRIQSKTHTIGTYKINKFSLLCFDDKIYIKTMDMMD